MQTLPRKRGGEILSSLNLGYRRAEADGQRIFTVNELIGYVKSMLDKSVLRFCYLCSVQLDGGVRIELAELKRVYFPVLDRELKLPLIKIIATLNRLRIPANKAKYIIVPLPSADTVCGNNKTVNTNIVPMRRLQPVSNDLVTSFPLLNSVPTKILPSSAPNTMAT